MLWLPVLNVLPVVCQRKSKLPVVSSCPDSLWTVVFATLLHQQGKFLKRKQGNALHIFRAEKYLKNIHIQENEFEMNILKFTATVVIATPKS